MQSIDIPSNFPETEFSPDFIVKMLNRMLVSFHKYGKVSDAYPEKVDAIASLIKRLELYHETKNTEWLVDVANFAMIEFMFPRHSEAYFKGTDSNASPGRTKADGQRTKKTNDDL